MAGAQRRLHGAPGQGVPAAVPDRATPPRHDRRRANAELVVACTYGAVVRVSGDRLCLREHQTMVEDPAFLSTADATKIAIGVEVCRRHCAQAPAGQGVPKEQLVQELQAQGMTCATRAAVYTATGLKQYMYRDKVFVSLA
jgi:hypothetical protein